MLFRHFYESRFPSLWEGFDGLVRAGRIVSVRDVGKEISVRHKEDRLAKWAKSYPSLFHLPTEEELLFVTELLRIRHFQTMIKRQSILEGRPSADPFVIAKAKYLPGTVVTQELRKKNASGIPNACERFSVSCINLEGFMEREDWSF